MGLDADQKTKQDQGSFPSRECDSWHQPSRSLPMQPAKIVTLREFAELTSQEERRAALGTIVASSGGFDPFHYGHGESLLRAKELGDTLVVIVNGESYLRQKKGVPLMDLDTRCRTLSYVRGVDFVIPFECRDDNTVSAALRIIRPHIFAKGGDWSDPSSFPERDVIHEIGCQLRLGVGGAAKNVSSSEILAQYRKNFNMQQ